MYKLNSDYQSTTPQTAIDRMDHVVAAADLLHRMKYETRAQELVRIGLQSIGLVTPQEEPFHDETLLTYFEHDNVDQDEIDFDDAYTLDAFRRWYAHAIKDAEQVLMMDEDTGSEPV